MFNTFRSPVTRFVGAGLYITLGLAIGLVIGGAYCYREFSKQVSYPASVSTIPASIFCNNPGLSYVNGQPSFCD